jgi:hypothetical protein
MKEVINELREIKKEIHYKGDRNASEFVIDVAGVVEKYFPNASFREPFDKNQFCLEQQDKNKVTQKNTYFMYSSVSDVLNTVHAPTPTGVTSTLKPASFPVKYFLEGFIEGVVDDKTYVAFHLDDHPKITATIYAGKYQKGNWCKRLFGFSRFTESVISPGNTDNKRLLEKIAEDLRKVK